MFTSNIEGYQYVGPDSRGHWEANVTEIHLFESPVLSPSYILRGEMKNWVYRRKMDTGDELLAISHFGCCCLHK